MTRAVLPVPLGRLTVPRTIWSALRGSTPRRIETSTEASNLAGEDFCARRSASSGVYTRSSSIRAAPFLYALLRKPMSSALHRDAHGTSGALDDLRRGVHVVRVQIRHLGLRDLADLCLGDLADLVGVRDGGALLEAGGLLDELGGRRGLRDDGERAVLVDRDLDRDDVATLIGGAIVVGLRGLHHVRAGSAERGTHGRRRCGLAGLDLELDDARDLLLGSHCSSSLWCGPGGAHHALLPLRGPYSLMAGTGPRYDVTCTSRRRRPESGVILVVLARHGGRAAAQILATWSNASSTGVSRPKMDTRTSSFWASEWISEIVAGMVSKGPSMTVTDSPTWKSGTFCAAAAALPAPAPEPRFLSGRPTDGASIE